MKLHFLFALAFTFLFHFGAFSENNYKPIKSEQTSQSAYEAQKDASLHQTNKSNAHSSNPYADDGDAEDEDEDEEEDEDEDDDDMPSSNRHYSTSGGANSPSSLSQNKNSAERTLSIIKPDGVRNNHIGDIIARFEKNGLKVVAIRMTQLSKDQAGQFYQEHKERPFYNDLIQSMSSGPVVLLVLEGKDAVNKNRDLMGATNPEKASKGTIRADFAKTVTENTVHGSDSTSSAKREILFFFPGLN